VSPVDKLKVWNIAELYPPGYAGGAAVYVGDTCRLLAGRGHDIRVLCSEANDTPPYTLREEVLEGVKVYRMNLPHFRNKDPGGWMLTVAQWKAHCAEVNRVVETLLATWQPDIVQFHTPYSLLEECLPALERRGIPIVGMTHDAWTICLRTSLFKSPTDTFCGGPSVLKCLECLYSYWDGSHAKALALLPWRAVKLGVFPAYRLKNRNKARGSVSGMIATSKFMADMHSKVMPGVKQISLGIDLKGVPRTSPSRPRVPLRFGFAAGFMDHKGIWDVLDCAASLKKRGYLFELHVWGPRQDEGPVIQRGIQDRVKLRGVYESSKMWDAYSEMDILLMATRWAEPYGRVVQEAAACGVPSIAPRIGGITEQIRHGVDGLLFNFRDKVDLERQMTRVLEEPKLLTELAANLWQVVDTREAVKEMESFYLNLLAEKTT
jgi:glycosyltransferase involved in cell wall biosynthesis